METVTICSAHQTADPDCPRCQVALPRGGGQRPFLLDELELGRRVALMFTCEKVRARRLQRSVEGRDQQGQDPEE